MITSLLTLMMYSLGLHSSAQLRMEESLPLLQVKQAIELQTAPVFRLPVVSLSTQLADSTVVFDRDSRGFVVREEPDQVLPLASLTKLMTVLVTLRHHQLDDVLVVPERVRTLPPALMGLVPGEQISVRALLQGLLISSANDAAETLAEGTGDRSAFIGEMNSTATDLGLPSLQYGDPAGLNDQSRGSATDLARLMDLVARQPDVLTIMRQQQLTVTDVTNKHQYKLKTTNLLFKEVPLAGFVGGKTGYTEAAGYNLAAMTTESSGRQFITVILHAKGETKPAAAEAVRAAVQAVRGQ